MRILDWIRLNKETPSATPKLDKLIERARNHVMSPEEERLRLESMARGLDKMQPEKFAPAVEMETFEGGANRTPVEARYDLVVSGFYDAMALVMGRGAKVRGGKETWKAGGPEFIQATINHLEKHLQNWKAGKLPEEGEDDLAAVAVNAMFLWWFDQQEQDGWRDPPIHWPAPSGSPDDWIVADPEVDDITHGNLESESLVAGSKGSVSEMAREEEEKLATIEEINEAGKRYASDWLLNPAAGPPPLPYPPILREEPVPEQDSTDPERPTE